MRFTLKIESDNAAMVDAPQAEVSRLVYEGASAGKVRDSNGNTVGSFKLETE